MHRFSTAFVSIIVVATGCSIFNREGPTVTCADLQNGVVNACKDGIIASCAGGAVAYCRRAREIAGI
jgi:hypothetical protein